MEIEYDGTNYAGWQYQPSKITIQGELERALFQLCQKKIKITGASRTDAGVSALGQIANFNIAALRFRNLKYFQLSLNAILPVDICVRKIKTVPDNFNSRYSSKGKIYQYKIINNRSPLRQRFAWVRLCDLDLYHMRSAAKLFLNHKDYAIFCSIKDKNGEVVLRTIKINKINDEINIKVEANRFLYKMIRRIVGALIEIGRGHRIEDDIKKALTGQKHHPLMCAPAKGLMLVKVKY